MLRHFLVPWVWIGYSLIITLFASGIVPVHQGTVTAGSVVLLIVDILAHTQNHPRGQLAFPLATCVWSSILSGLASAPGIIQSGGQVVFIFVAQAFWDLSWHSVYNHRHPKEARTLTDSNFVRLGAATVALLAAFAPLLAHRTLSN